VQDVSAIDDFRANLRSACEKHDISQRELARRSEVHYVTVNRILKGILTNPTIDVCERLAKAAGVPLPKIFKTPVDSH